MDLAVPEDDVADERGVFSRHSDTRLQTRLTPKGLQKRLLELYFDARTLEEEQGVNILYLTLGMLRWVDPGNAANIRHAPLLLIPVSLERGNAGEKFKLRARPEEFASNLSLEAWLDRVHGIRLPAFEASDGFDPMAYMDEVAETVAAKTGWAVLHDDMALGFFSFAKFLMYRDLDPANWPDHARISDRPLVRGLLADGFQGAEGMIPEEAKIVARAIRPMPAIIPNCRWALRLSPCRNGGPFWIISNCCAARQRPRWRHFSRRIMPSPSSSRTSRMCRAMSGM